MLRAARTLHRALAGEAITRADLRTPALATLGSRLVGRDTLEVRSVGKHLLHRIDGGLTLHSHLRMEGRWRVLPPERASRSLAAATARDRVRALIATRTAVAIGERLGMVDLIDTAGEHWLIGHLGPDILAADFDPTVVLAHLAVDGRAVAESLLDQRVVAGLGTLWVSESLFAAGVWPWVPASSLQPGTLTQVLSAARSMMSAAVAEPGGRRQSPAVHAKAGRACERCWATIRSGTVGTAPRARQLPYCPSCQGPTATAGESLRPPR